MDWLTLTPLEIKISKNFGMRDPRNYNAFTHWLLQEFGPELSSSELDESKNRLSEIWLKISYLYDDKCNTTCRHMSSRS